MQEMKLQELKSKTPNELLTFAEQHDVGRTADTRSFFPIPSAFLGVDRCSVYEPRRQPFHHALPLEARFVGKYAGPLVTGDNSTVFNQQRVGHNTCYRIV